MTMHKIPEQTWLVTHEDAREDLWWFQHALGLGWRGETECPIVNGLPQGWISFWKGDTYLWRATHSGDWYAKEPFINPDEKGGVRQYKSLKEALELESFLISGIHIMNVRRIDV
jgi:hypothetical protein